MMGPGILPAMMTLENVPVKPMSLVTNASSVLQEILDSHPVMVKFLYSNKLFFKIVNDLYLEAVFISHSLIIAV